MLKVPPEGPDPEPGDTARPLPAPGETLVHRAVGRRRADRRVRGLRRRSDVGGFGARSHSRYRATLVAPPTIPRLGPGDTSGSAAAGARPAVRPVLTTDAMVARNGAGRAARGPRETRRVKAEPPLAGSIEILGAREHNLRVERLVLPKNALVVLTGPSGSGKSSLAF